MDSAPGLAFVYSCEGRSYRVALPLTEPQALFVRSKAGEIGEAPTITQLIVGAAGVAARVAGLGVLRFLPDGWRSFWKDQPEVGGAAAVAAWSKWQAHVLEHNAQYAVAQIEAGRLSFEDLREQLPEVFAHPLVRDALVARFVADAMPRRKPGKRAKVTEDQWRLYAWASWYYLTGEAGSWEAACGVACDEHADLVPRTWVEDPAGNLKKLAARVFDRHPLRAQSRLSRWDK